MNKKGQGALEYLLIIGGAVLVAAIVISLMLSTATPTKCATQDSLLNALCAQFGSQASCAAGDPDGAGSASCAATDCSWDTTDIICKAEAAGTRSSTCFPC